MVVLDYEYNNNNDDNNNNAYTVCIVCAQMTCHLLHFQ